MKKAKIITTLIIILILILTVLTILIDNNSIPLFALFMVFMGLFTFRNIESNSISVKVGKRIVEKKYDEAIEILKEKTETCLIYSNALSSLITLVIIYMMNNNIDEVKELLKNKRLKNNNNITFINLILALEENNIDLAKEYNEKLQKQKSKRYDIQKEASDLIFKMIEKGNYNRAIEAKTEYPLVIEICKRYTTDR